MRAHAATMLALEREADSRGGLPVVEHFLLVQVARGPETGTRPSDLATRTGLTKSGVTRAVDRLERDGYVERRACPSDARGLHILITSQGRRLLKRAAPSHMRAIAEHFVDPLSPEELVTMSAALERIAAAG